MKVIRVNKDKKVKWRYRHKNKLITFYLLLKVVFYLRKMTNIKNWRMIKQL